MFVQLEALMKLGIGIDTGGTYTDAVIYDFDNNTILGTAKSLTTKNDLSIGILGAIDGLPADLARQAEIVSLSTTLATNACVEDRGGRAKLIFFGGDPKAIDEFGGKYGLPPSTDIYTQECLSDFNGEIKREPDWELFRRQLDNGFDQLDGVGIIEVNAIRNGAVIEKKAREIFQSAHNIPVVCCHELFSDLGCLKRGAGTLVNASLIPIIKEFLTAVKKALAIRNINAALVIVRSDGSLMSEAFAALRPVETLLCGPAASTIGGTRLTDNPNSIIVDMGGTTTDIALVKDGVPVTVTDGITIGKWKTFVNGLYIKTFGLGGDSAVHYDETKLYLEDYRVTPLCIAAQKYPAVIDSLKALQIRRHTHFLYEHYMLIKDIGDSARYTDEEKAFCAALRESPLIFSEAAAAIGKEIYTLDVKRLIKDGVVQICGLTPTDVMHIKGDFDSYCTEASLLGAEFAAYNLGMSVEEFCDSVYEEVKRKLYAGIVKTLLEYKYPEYMKKGVNKDVERFINENFAAAGAGNYDNMLSSMFKTEYSLVGIGAPIHIFLDDVAKRLDSHAVIPKHYEVANALGAIISSVSVSHSVEVLPVNSAGILKGYTVFGNNENITFQRSEEAIDFAVSQAKEGAQAKAVKHGAKGELTVTLDIFKNEAETRDCAIYLGTTVTARAAGSIGF